MKGASSSSGFADSGVFTSTVRSGLEASPRKAANYTGIVRAPQTTSAEGHSSSRNTSMAKPCPAG